MSGHALPQFFLAELGLPIVVFCNSPSRNAGNFYSIAPKLPTIRGEPMAIIKSSPSELAIHGGGPPAFSGRVPVFSANVGDGHRFAELAERMFLANEAPGRMVEEFEEQIASWLGVRNVIGFSSLSASIHCLDATLPSHGKRYVPAFGASVLPVSQSIYLECESSTYGMSPEVLADQLREDAVGVFAACPLGRPCMIEEIEDLCNEWAVPLFLYGHQSLGNSYRGEALGSFGRAEIYDLGRDQLVHALDAAVIATEDDLLAHRLRTQRSQRSEGIDLSMGDAAAAMGIANLESVGKFVESNRLRYDQYAERLLGVPGMKLIRQERGSSYQSITIEVDPGQAGLHRDSLRDILTSENVGTAKPFDGARLHTLPVASRAANSLLQLPSGPAATDEIIEAVCKLVELAVIRSLESPDPIQLAA